MSDLKMKVFLVNEIESEAGWGSKIDEQHIFPTADLTKKYDIRHLYENKDTSFEYFNVNTYTINGKDIRNWLPIRRKKIGTFKTPIKNELVEQNRDQVEFWYNDSWLNLLEHLFIYKNYSFKDLCN